MSGDTIRRRVTFVRLQAESRITMHSARLSTIYELSKHTRCRLSLKYNCLHFVEIMHDGILMSRLKFLEFLVKSRQFHRPWDHIGRPETITMELKGEALPE